MRTKCPCSARSSTHARRLEYDIGRGGYSESPRGQVSITQSQTERFDFLDDSESFGLASSSLRSLWSFGRSCRGRFRSSVTQQQAAVRAATPKDAVLPGL